MGGIFINLREEGFHCIGNILFHFFIKKNMNRRYSKNVNLCYMGLVRSWVHVVEFSKFLFCG